MILPIFATIFVLSFALAFVMYVLVPSYPSDNWLTTFGIVGIVAFASGVATVLAAIWRI